MVSYKVKFLVISMMYLVGVLLRLIVLVLCILFGMECGCCRKVVVGR